MLELNKDRIMKLFKNICTCVLVLTGMVINAQEGPKIPEFNARIVVGIIRYDEEIACKKIKLKKEEEIATVSKHIIKFNRAMDELKFRHFVKLNDIELLVNMKQKVAMASRDYQAMTELQIETHEKLSPIKTEVKELADTLTKALENSMSAKQFKKWKKYAISVQKELFPSVERKHSPVMNNNSSMRGMNRGMNRGMGRRMY